MVFYVGDHSVTAIETTLAVIDRDSQIWIACGQQSHAFM
jgi:hypothetical protein